VNYYAKPCIGRKWIIQLYKPAEDMSSDKYCYPKFVVGE